MTIKEIENNWVENFKNSPLIKNGTINRDIASGLFNGFADFESPTFKRGIGFVRVSFQISEADFYLSWLIEFLHFIGINISKEAILREIKEENITYEEIFKRSHYLFRQLTEHDESFDINNPFSKSSGDIFFFLKIQRKFLNLIRQEANYEGVEYEVVDTGLIKSTPAVQIKTINSGKLWATTVQQFTSNFENGKYLTEDTRVVKEVNDFIGLRFTIQIDKEFVSQIKKNK